MKDKLHKLLDTPALAAAMLVDFALVGISLFVIAPGPIEKAGMVLLALVVVLFSVRGWVIGNRLGKALWVCFALASFFIDLSFALVATDVQAQATVDQELVRLTEKVDEAEKSVVDLQGQYDRAGTRATMDQLQAQIDTAEAKAAKYRQDRESRLNRFESGGSKEITSSALSTAIPDAIASGKPGRITFLVLFSLIFAGLQLTMITAASASFAVQSDIIKPDTVVHKQRAANNDVARFVKVTWTYLRNGRSDAVVNRTSFEKLMKKSPNPVSMETWDSLMTKAVSLGLIKNGRIVEKNEGVAIQKLST